MSWSPRSSFEPTRVLAAANSAALPLASLVTPRAEERFVPGCERTIEDQLEAARREGYEQGRAEALESAEAAAVLARHEAWQTTLERLLAAAAAAADSRASILSEVIGEAVDLAFELLGALLDDELSGREEPARDAVLRALKLVPSEESLLIRVHPTSLLAAEEFSGILTSAQIEVLHDPEIEPTGCVVEAGACRIDAQLGPALERVRQALLELRAPQAVVPA